MIARWIDLCVRNRFLVFTGTILLVLAGIWAMRRIPLDALPDISDVQVIIHTSWAGEPPNVIEDQVTYPIVTTLLAAPRVKAVRAQTMFGDSYVFVVFRGWHRSLLGAFACHRIPPADRGDAFPPRSIRRSGLTPPAQAGCMNIASSITATATVSPTCAASRIGTSAISLDRSRGGRGRDHRRLCPAISGPVGSQQAPAYSIPLSTVIDKVKRQHQ